MCLPDAIAAFSCSACNGLGEQMSTIAPPTVVKVPPMFLGSPPRESVRGEHVIAAVSAGAQLKRNSLLRSVPTELDSLP